MATDTSKETVDVKRTNKIGRIAAGDIARRAGNRMPEKTAFIVPEKDEQVTFSEFDQRANRASNALLDAGYEKGSRIAFVAGNSLQFLEAYFGALKAGVVPVFINPEITPEDIAYEFDHSDADALFVDDVLYEKTAPLLEDRDMDTVATFEWGETDVPEESFRAFTAGCDESESDVEIHDTDLAQIMYTSGTTSKPKGVLHSHKTIYTGSLNVATNGDLTRHDVMGSVMPLFHCAQLTMIKGAMHVSATTVIRRDFGQEAFLADVEERDLSWSFLLPVMYEGLLNRDDIDERDLSSLRFCLYAMTPMGNEVLKQCIETFDADFALGSGQTEAYPPTVIYQPEWQLEKEGNYWGTGNANTDVAIMNDEGELLPQGEVGEIVYRGPNVMEGYLKNPEETKQAFEHGWFHSGDMGFFDEDHLLKFVDRKKDMIKTGGENVSTQKIESILLDNPHIAEVAVVGLPHDRWGEAVTAVVVPTADSEVNEESLLEYSREHLAGFETPKSIEIVDELPKTTTGKIRKFELAADWDDYYQ
ncbi:AMP-binding protein [Natrinema sp. 1APR25-10V2]|uniref:AMP-binding protein n=1 Tax=Natrinema sp. 1APR25-10V2 TaxID=2951081 RepID=UPI002874E59B|nr:AMP-binding protein [Natrinema sp. 1APR25-10V2]MDS0476958.1 AMP-binding protein [Natrinema sp. 1APR25-10V2]